jgi:hypothetical protein
MASRHETADRPNGAPIVPSPRSVRPVLLALASFLTMIGAPAATAHAEYGELAPSIVEAGKIETSRLKPHVFGIEPDGKNYYLGDEVTRTENSKEVHLYRIQQFNAGGQALAEATIKVNERSEVLENGGLEGIAINTAEKRLYVLVDRQRESEEQVGEPTFDPEVPAAANLYAFSTEVKSGEHTLKQVKNVPLPWNSEVEKEPLLEPHGIAVDSANNNVAILGQEDEQTTKGEEHELRAAVQFVAPNGTLGPRYVDTTNCLDGGEDASETEPACVEGPSHETQPFSPIVAAGKVYVERRGEIWELPAGKELSAQRFETDPKRLLPTESNPELGPEQTRIEFPSSSESFTEAVGGSMSFTPEGAAGEGKIYLTGSIDSNAGVLVLGYTEHSGAPEAKELGWTGGEAESSPKCSIPKKGNETLMVGGGEKEDVFVFDVHEQLGQSAAGADVFEFGPGGTGCPPAEAKEPSVKIKNSSDEEVEVTPVPLGETTMLSSEMVAGNAKSVEWKFKNLTSGKEEAKDKEEEEEAASYQFKATSLKHVFQEVGEYEIKEIIETDDLATPKLEVTRKVSVAATPIAVEFSYPGTITAGRAAKFEAVVNDPHEPGSPKLKYTWTFGGEERSGEANATEFAEEHTFPAEAAQESVTLKVTDAHGVVGEKTHVIAVGRAEEHKEEHHEEHKEEAKVETPKTEPAHEAPKTEGPPEATLAGNSLSVGPTGSVSLKVGCPASDSSCSGSITLRTQGAVAARVSARGARNSKARKRRKAVVTLASGSFTVVGGQTATVTLHLSAAGRALLARAHTLHVLAIVLAHDPAGASHTTQTTVTLRAPAKSKRHKR